MIRPHKKEGSREILRVLTRLASGLIHPVFVLGMWKKKDHEHTMEDFLNWELGQYEQKRAKGHHHKHIIRLENPIHKQPRNGAEREMRLRSSKSDIIKGCGGSASTVTANGKPSGSSPANGQQRR